MDEPARIGSGHDLGAQLRQLLDGVEGDVARAGHDGGLALDSVVASSQHLAHEIDAAVACGLGADQTPAKREPFARQRACEAVGEPLVHPEHVANLPLPDSDVSGGHIGVLADVPREFHHERVAETHHLAVSLALRIEVRPPFAPSHGQGRQAVLQDLLEPQELQNAQRHGRVEPHPALVRPDRIVELHAPGAVCPEVAVPVLPGHAEHDHPVGLGHPFQYLVLPVFRVLAAERNDRLRELLDRLVEFWLARIPPAKAMHEVVDVCLDSR